MDKITHEVRLSNWKAVIEQCQSRPKGQNIASWCKENGIGVKQYYYWQRRVRKKAVQTAPAALLPSSPREESQVSFAEISFSQQTQTSSCMIPPTACRCRMTRDRSGESINKEKKIVVWGIKTFNI